MQVLHLHDLRGADSGPSVSADEVNEASRVLAEVRRRGDEVLLERMGTGRLRVPEAALQQAASDLAPELRRAVRYAVGGLRRFADRQKRALREFRVRRKGLMMGQRLMPVGRVGILVRTEPHPAVSSLLTAAVFASVAGVRDIAVAVGHECPLVLAACHAAGVHEVYRLHGAEAVAAFTYGTASVKPVDMLVGHGAPSVVAAKFLVHGEVGLDALRGPGDLLVVADNGADVQALAADLLTHAETEPEGRLWLVTLSIPVAAGVEEAATRLLEGHPDCERLQAAMDAVSVVVVANLDEAVYAANLLAPETLVVHSRRAARLVRRLRHYGTLMLGRDTALPLGSHAMGPSNLLPVGGQSRFASGLSVYSFLRVSTWQTPSRRGIEHLLDTLDPLLQVQGLEAWRRLHQRRREG
ncbi:MAG: histidinol dehydrogenase [Candidatus Xenobia bacterium]